MSDKPQKIIFSFSLVVIAIGFWFWADRPKTVSKSLFAMGTVFEITATGKNPETAIDAAFSEIKRLENLTRQTGKSDIEKINRNAGIKPVKVGPEVITILKLIQENYQKLSGAFDPTVAPLIDLWGFGTEGKPHLPSNQDIIRILPLVNFQYLKIDYQQKTVFLSKHGMRLDLGGIAKGYAVDQAYRILRSNWINSALINGGSSSIRVIGSKSGKPWNPGTPWKLGIGHPRRSGNLLGILKLPNDRALGTSADTQNFFLNIGVRYSHLIDPRNGMPVRDKILLTVTAPTATEADMLSTAFFVLPASKIKYFLEKHPGIKVIIYDSHQTVSNFGEKSFQIDD